MAGQVIGIGGVFFKSQNPGDLSAWYRDHLGFSGDPHAGVQFKWEKDGRPHTTVWSVFPDATSYFDPSKAPFMMNYIVDDLDAILIRLKAEGVNVDPKVEDYSYGRFGWIFDPDGNKIELWQPKPK